MEIKMLAVLSVILIVMCIASGCTENDKNITFNKNIEMVSAWEGVTSDENPTSPPSTFMELNFSEQDYQKIALSDGNTKLTQSWETIEEDGYPYNLYKFNCNESISSIRISWEGDVSQPFMSNIESKIGIYYYNIEKSVWDKIISEKWNNDASDQRTLTKITKNIHDYTDEQNDIFVFIIGPYGGGDSTATLSTDFIELKGA